MDVRKDVLDELIAIGSDLAGACERIRDVIGCDDRIGNAVFMVSGDKSGAIDPLVYDRDGTCYYLESDGTLFPIPF
ncbi:MAG: hypothetical protein IIZ12_05965 [Eggerthellaceae bacterium]|nr:hypothetical protein [Eggerthellaceae bacterium]